MDEQLASGRDDLRAQLAALAAPGATPFVSSTASLLRDAGVAGAHIRQDKYLGYKPRPRTAMTSATAGVVPASG